MDLTIVSQDADVAQLKVRGRVTQRQVPSSTDLMVDLLGPDAYTRTVLVDLHETEFIDSSGISWLLLAHKRFREQGGRFVLYALPPMVMNVLKVLKMQLVFELAATHSEALGKIQGAAP